MSRNAHQEKQSAKGALRAVFCLPRARPGIGYAMGKQVKSVDRRYPRRNRDLFCLRRRCMTRDRARGRIFDATDAGVFAERCFSDRHQSRSVVVPDEVAELSDRHSYTQGHGERWRAASGPGPNGRNRSLEQLQGRGDDGTRPHQLSPPRARRSVRHPVARPAASTSFAEAQGPGRRRLQDVTRPDARTRRRLPDGVIDLRPEATRPVTSSWHCTTDAPASWSGSA